MIQSMRYEVILFDADDTLFDYGRSEADALGGALLEFGIEPEPGLTESYRAINRELWDTFEKGGITLERLRVERFDRLFGSRGLGVEGERFSAVYLERLGQGTHLINGAEELCAALMGRCRLAVITNGIKAVQMSRIGRSVLKDCFETVVVSEDAGCQKPEPGIFDYTFRALGLEERDKERVLMVGDSLTSDIRGGIRYGLDTCWFNPMGRPVPDGLQPTYTIRELKELTELLKL